MTDGKDDSIDSFERGFQVFADTDSHDCGKSGTRSDRGPGLTQDIGGEILSPVFSGHFQVPSAQMTIFYIVNFMI